jgi:DinB superfamily
MTVDYTTLSLAGVAAELSAIARDTQSVFGLLDERQLNWRPDATRWSVAQCFDHLLSANREMFQALDAATDASRPRTVWQRLPVLPRVFGPMMIKSQMPGAKRKFTAARKAEPAASAIDPRIVERFVAYQHEAAARVRSLDGRDMARVIMVSPFVSFITYSVLDGCRLIVTHERRHFEQARRVTQAPGFPSSA